MALEPLRIELVIRASILPAVHVGDNLSPLVVPVFSTTAVLAIVVVVMIISMKLSLFPRESRLLVPSPEPT